MTEEELNAYLLEREEEVLIEKRKEAMKKADDYLSNFDNPQAGLTAYFLGLSLEEARSIGYR